jgi:diguanylate cyclase (GGDEF)-like protein
LSTAVSAEDAPVPDPGIVSRHLAALEALLRQVADVVARGGQAGEVFDAVAARAAEVLGGDCGGVLRLHPDPPSIELIGSCGTGATSSAPSSATAAEPGSLAGIVLRTGESVVVADVGSHNGGATDGMLATGTRAAVAAPINVGEEVWGVLLVGSPRLGAFDEQDAAALTAFADVAAMSIAGVGSPQARADRSLRDARLAALQAALHRTARAVAEDAVPESVAPVVAAEVLGLIGGDVAAVLCFEDHHARVLGVWPPVLAAMARELPRLPIGDALAAAQARRAGRPVRSHYAPESDPVAKHFGLRAGAAAPVFTAAGAWGVVTIGRASDEPLPDATEMVLAQFAAMVAIAVDSAEARGRLRELATRDPLTGLVNHRAFQEQLAEEVERANRNGRDLALALIDLDAFKGVNDRHGHQAGDAVLRAIARSMEQAVRTGSTVARLGGDELAMLLPESGATAAVAVAERVRARLSQALAGEDAPAVTFSAGVADLATAGTGEVLIRLADAALYRAKASGRGRTCAHGLEP